MIYVLDKRCHMVFVVILVEITDKTRKINKKNDEDNDTYDWFVSLEWIGRF